MSINKVVYGGKTLIDLTGDTVTADKLLKGITAHGKDGEAVTGICTYDVDSNDATVAVAEILKGKTAYARGAKLVSKNIREGITILGVKGSMASSEGMKPQSKTVTPSSTQQTVLPDEGYNCLSQVVVEKIPYVESENSAGGLTVTIG